MQDIYNYIAIFTFDSDGITIEFPDLPGCLSCADSYQEAYENAEEALSLHLYNMEQSCEEIPTPSCIENIELDKNQRTALIKANMRLARAKIENITVKKTITLPSYMNIWGEQNHINFSKLLQEQIRLMMQNDKNTNYSESPVLFDKPNLTVSGTNEKNSCNSKLIAVKFDNDSYEREQM